MPSPKDSPNRNETFGRLLSGAINSIATYEGRTALVVEEELGQLLVLSGKTIQRYKAGHIPPEPETVKVLAEAAVRRGFLDREWLQRFLHAARYPFTDALLNELRPTGPTRLRLPHVYENLPAPTYSQFIMRVQAFADVIDGLQQRSAVVLIVGLGGNGKTSLAREIAAQCLIDDSSAPRFDAVVWVSDKDRPSTTNLSIVLDEIARTLDYPGFTQFEHEEKRREVEQLLRRQRVLVVIDNFETITDGALLAWLLRLPEPSKALITSREYTRAFRNSSITLDLRGLGETEADAFISQRLKYLRMDNLISSPSQFDPLVAATGGNPKALEMALGIVKHERRPIQQIVDDLYAARGELFDDLFTRAWSLLDEGARRVLLAMTFFPSNANGEALGVTADVQGFAFDRAMERLTDLALVDLQQISLTSTPRYTLHPLVRAFVGSRLAEQVGFEIPARERWVNHFLTFSRQCDAAGWDSFEQLDRVEQDITNLEAVMRYCYDKHFWEYLIDMVMASRSFWGIRGYYETRDAFVAIAIYAAEQTANLNAQISLLCSQIRSLCYQHNVEVAVDRCNRATILINTLEDPEPSILMGLNYARIRVCLLLGDLDNLFTVAQQNVAIAQAQGWRRQILAKYDIAEYLYQAGRFDEAEELLQQIITQSIEAGYIRAPIFGWLCLANIALNRAQIALAEKYLKQAEERARELKHQRFLALVNRAWAQLDILRKDFSAARVAFSEAIDRFERLGMRHEVAKARADLEKIDALERQSADVSAI